MSEKLDLNRATVGDLEKISGITRTLARRIIAARDRQGGFGTLALLRDIDGVTAELFTVLKDEIEAGAGPSEKTLTVRVNLDPQEQHKGEYGSYKVTAELVAMTGLSGTEQQVAVPRAITADASVDGLATLTLPDSASIQGPITFIVRAPDGQIMTRADRAKSDLRETLPLPVVPRSITDYATRRRSDIQSTDETARARNRPCRSRADREQAGRDLDRNDG